MICFSYGLQKYLQLHYQGNEDERKNTQLTALEEEMWCMCDDQV